MTTACTEKEKLLVGIDDTDVSYNPEWRTGKWTVEEEVYAAKLIEYFTTGQLILKCSDGRTLRSFLAKRLNCNPMRISKKFSCLEGMGVRYQQVEYSFETILVNQEILQSFEDAFRMKDIAVQSRRIKRRQYRQNSEEKSRQKRRNEALQVGQVNEADECDDTSGDDEIKHCEADHNIVDSFSDTMQPKDVENVFYSGLSSSFRLSTGATSSESLSSSSYSPLYSVSKKRKSDVSVMPSKSVSPPPCIKKAKISLSDVASRSFYRETYGMSENLRSFSTSFRVNEFHHKYSGISGNPLEYAYTMAPEKSIESYGTVTSGAVLLLEAANILASGFETCAKHPVVGARIASYCDSDLEPL